MVMSSLSVFGGSLERQARRLSRFRWRGRRGERRGGWGGGDGQGVRRNRTPSGGTAARGAARRRVRRQGLEHTATPLLNGMLREDRDSFNAFS